MKMIKKVKLLTSKMTAQLTVRQYLTITLLIITMISLNINNKDNNNNSNSSKSNSTNKINQEDIFLVEERVSNLAKIDHLVRHLMTPKIHHILNMNMASLSLSKSRDLAQEQTDNSNHIERLS